MTVHINRPLAKTSRALGRDRFLLKVAPMLRAIQREGNLGCAAIAARLNEAGLPSPRGGAWCASTVWHYLGRARELGIPLIRRSRAEGAVGRPVSYRPRGEKRV